MEERREEISLEEMESAYRKIQELEAEEERKFAVEMRFLDQMYEDTNDAEIRELIDEKKAFMKENQRKRADLVTEMSAEIQRMQELEDQKENEDNAEQGDEPRY